MKKVFYNSEGYFIGRNGCFRMRGIDINNDLNLISLNPITSKGQPGNCVLTIPKEDLETVIEALKSINL